MTRRQHLSQNILTALLLPAIACGAADGSGEFAATLSQARGPLPRIETTHPKAAELSLPPLLQSTPENDVFVATGVLQWHAKETKSFVLPKLRRITGTLIGKGVAWSFRAPSGELIVPGRTAGRAGYAYSLDREGVASFMLDNPEEGAWTVVSSSQADTSVSYMIDISSEGPADEVAHLEVMLRGSDPRAGVQARPGDHVFVRTYVARNGRPITEAQWDVRALTPSKTAATIPVFDDGEHLDGKAGDGVFVGSIVAGAGGNGLYRLLADARMRNGVQYRVVKTFECQVKNDLLIADAPTVTPKLPIVGKSVSATITAKNDGTIEFTNATLELYVDSIKWSEQHLDLRPGESRRVTTEWTPQRAGDCQVQLTLTSDDESSSSDFENNTRMTLVHVRDPSQ